MGRYCGRGGESGIVSEGCLGGDWRCCGEDGGVVSENWCLGEDALVVAKPLSNQII